MTVLRSREIAPPKTTPHGSKTRLKSEPSAPAETPESATATLQSSPPPLTSSHPQNPNPNSNPNPKPGTDSGMVSRRMRRRSLRLASKSPESAGGSTKRNTLVVSAMAGEVVREDTREKIEGNVSNGEVGFDLFGKRVTVMGVEQGTEELKVGCGSDMVTELSGKGSGFGVDEGVRSLTELGPSSDLDFGDNSEEKKKRKLDIDINLPASECEEEDGGSKCFLSLRSGKRVAKRGVDGVSNGESGNDLSADKNGSVKSIGEPGRGEKGKGKLGVNNIDVVVLDSEDEVERSNENVSQSDLPSGGSSTGKGQLSGAIEGGVDDSEDEMISGENGINEGRRKYSRQEKGKDKLVGEALLLNDNDKVELHLGSELLSSVHNVVPSPSQIVENSSIAR
ncbi:hypothetical protein M0R45_003678 [Rubus argutus]|uniref:Uncharacterized protein n=1 Tax=Rubus argutus TaxID=59490 RepID=A0AAW1YI48_RUBAR